MGYVIQTCIYCAGRPHDKRASHFERAPETRRMWGVSVRFRVAAASQDEANAIVADSMLDQRLIYRGMTGEGEER